MEEDRKFVSITPIKIEKVRGIYLYAIADDGTAWRGRQEQGGGGGALFEGWVQVPNLPSDPYPD